MTDQVKLSIGMVGTRAYELQAWQAPGASAVEQAYWAVRIPPNKPPLKARLMQIVNSISAVAVSVASSK
jgi:hypothetical protein